MLKYYVALCAGVRKVVPFQGYIQPNEADRLVHEANAFIGPFRTKRGAEYMRDFGAGNPHCQTVAQAERLAKNTAEVEKVKALKLLTARLQFLSDVMTTAVESGSDCIGYWASVQNVKRAADLSVLSFEVIDDEDRSTGAIHSMTPEKLHDAIFKIQQGFVECGRQYATQFIGYPGNTDLCDVDATGADIVIQVALFGEIRYS